MNLFGNSVKTSAQIDVLFFSMMILMVVLLIAFGHWSLGCAGLGKGAAESTYEASLLECVKKAGTGPGSLERSHDCRRTVDSRWGVDSGLHGELSP